MAECHRFPQFVFPRFGGIPRCATRPTRPSWGYWLRRVLPIALDADAVARFHVLREMRNAIIHTGGVIDERLVRCAGALTAPAAEEWKRITGRSPLRLRPGARVDFGVGELFLTLDTTKELAEQANWMLIPALSVDRWAEVIVDDFLRNGPANIWSARRPLTKLLGFAQFYYDATGVGELELRIAAAARKLSI